MEKIHQIDNVQLKYHHAVNCEMKWSDAATSVGLRMFLH